VPSLTQAALFLPTDNASITLKSATFDLFSNTWASVTVPVFEAVEKMLGLKLEQQTRAIPVTVIDHVEPNPKQQ